MEDHQGYLILVLALDSIHLNPYDNMSIGWVSAFPRPTQVTHLPIRSERGPTSREQFLTKSSMMVFISALLSRRAIQLSPLTLTLVTFLIPYHWWKGMGFKKGVCV